MNFTKNPRMKKRVRETADLFEAACDINIVNLANLLNALNRGFPKIFGTAGMKRFVSNFIDSVKAVDCDDDSEIRDHAFAEMMEDTPYINWNLSSELLKELVLKSPANKCIVMQAPEFYKALNENVALMLLTLHYDHGFGKDRIQRTIQLWRDSDVGDAVPWLEKAIGYEHDEEDDRRSIEDILLTPKKKERITVREQLDARRGLEALRAYQEEVKNG